MRSVSFMTVDGVDERNALKRISRHCIISSTRSEAP